MTDTRLCFVISSVLIALASSLSAGEYLAVSEIYGEDGLLPAKVLSERSYALPSSRLLRTISSLHSREMRGIFFLKFLSSAVLLVTCANLMIACWLLVALFILQLVITYRSVFGGDGSDQMSVIIYAGLSSSILLQSSRSLSLLGFGFIAAESALSYMVSGLAKLGSKVWRSGEALPKILETYTYGSPRIGRWLDSRLHLKMIGCWMVIAFECLFPYALIAPKPAMIFILAAGFCFHAANGYLMGLNVFMWVFLATYPSIVLINSRFNAVF
jgi:hypothetical protein